MTFLIRVSYIFMGELCSNVLLLSLLLILFYLVETNHYLPIHREAPAFVEQATEQQILVTGIKVCCFMISLSILGYFMQYLDAVCENICHNVMGVNCCVMVYT